MTAEPERELICECCSKSDAQTVLIPERSPAQLCRICKWIVVGTAVDKEGKEDELD